jgi:hypothetical protein
LEKGRKAPRWRPTLPHAGFGERDGENHMEQSMYGFSVPTLRDCVLNMNRKTLQPTYEFKFRARSAATG